MTCNFIFLPFTFAFISENESESRGFFIKVQISVPDKSRKSFFFCEFVARADLPSGEVTERLVLFWLLGLTLKLNESEEFAGKKITHLKTFLSKTLCPAKMTIFYGSEGFWRCMKPCGDRVKMSLLGFLIFIKSSKLYVFVFFWHFDKFCSQNSQYLKNVLIEVWDN